MPDFDLIIIGGGPAGYLAGERAGAAGLKTAVVEKRALGGVCLNEGCIPSKALLNSAKMYDHAAHGERYGVSAENPRLDHGKVLQRKNKVVKKLVAGVSAKLKQHGVAVLSGEATIEGRGSDGFTVRVGEETHTAARLLLAAGSVPILPPIPGVAQSLESGYALTSREVLDLPEVPESLVVVGGGVIGLEMASYYATAGARVTVVEMLDKIAGPTEAAASAALLKALEGQGIGFRLGCKVTAVDEKNGVTFEDKSGSQTLPAARVLLAIGRKASTAGLGLEALGLHLERGAVATDAQMRTSVAGIWAAGDINGKSMLAHTAYREAEVAVNDMLGKKDAMRYDAIPSVIYATPEVACVGETEETAAARGLAVAVKTLPMAYAGRYVAEVERGEGFCKLLLDDKRQCLVGAHLVGSYASEIIFSAGMMIELGLPLEVLRRQVFPHPTVGEIIRETLFEF